MDSGLMIRNVLRVLESGELQTVAVHDAPARGAGLYRSPDLDGRDLYAGVDLLVVPPHGEFPVHVHPGHHVLFVLRGSGSVFYIDRTHRTVPGDLVVIPADVAHNVAAGPAGQVLLAFGAPHMPIDSVDRMTVVNTDGDVLAATETTWSV